jgi:head-tail adaptor
MPYRKTPVASYRNRIVICSMSDVVEDNQMMRLKREAAIYTWAKINEEKKSSFAPSGFTVLEPSERTTHQVFIRARREVNFSSSAWIYEARLQSAPRWFKIISLSEYKEEVCFACHLVERSDSVSRPVDVTPGVTSLAALPRGVTL